MNKNTIISEVEITEQSKIQYLKGLTRAKIVEYFDKNIRKDTIEEISVIKDGAKLDDDLLGPCYHIKLIVESINANVGGYDIFQNKEARDDYILDMVTKLINYFPQNNSFYLLRSYLHFDRNELPKAIEDIDYCITHKKSNSLYLFHRACYLMCQNNCSSAILDFDRIIKYNPEEKLFYECRTYCNKMLHNIEQNEYDLVKINELDPNNSQNYKNLNAFYGSTGQFGKYLNYIEALIKEDPTDDTNYLIKSHLDYRLQNKDDFIRSIKNYIKYSKDFIMKTGLKLTFQKFISKGRSICFRDVTATSPKELFIEQVSDLNYDYTFTMLTVLLGIEKADFIDDKYHRLMNFLDSFDENVNDFPVEFKDIYSEIFKEPIVFDKTTVKVMLKFSIKQKLMDHLIDKIYDNSIIEKLSQSELLNLTDILGLFRYYSNHIHEKMVDEIKEIERKKAEDIMSAKLEERNEVIAKLSHSIKNLIRSAVIDPLALMEQSHSFNAKNISNALKGANIIREIVNGINLSFRGSLDDFYYDARNNSYESDSIHAMFIDSLKYSVSNMLDGKYFNVFMRKYFPTRDSYEKATNEWDKLGQSNQEDGIIDYMNSHLCPLSLNYSLDEDLTVGNQKGSAIKLLILFQEIVFNAVKYSSFVKHDERKIEINIDRIGDEIKFEVINSFNPENQAKSSGLGSIIIVNFSALLTGDLNITNKDNIYKVTLVIPNLWKKKEQI